MSGWWTRVSRGKAAQRHYYVSAISRLPSGSAAQPRLRMLPADDAPAQEASGYGIRYSALTKLAVR
ncbi:MAG: hypothetical protein ACLU3F_15185 [Blautia wexlerae]